jgi:nucleoside-diphosphate-sugar epimerase
MSAGRLAGQSCLVVGGAGFVGSNLVRALLCEGAVVCVVDNLLSSELWALPEDRRLTVVEGSIGDGAVLAEIGDVWDVIFHLGTFHGNQSSIARPLEDHEHNLLATLRLLEHVKDFSRARALVYASAGCVVAEKGTAQARPTSEQGGVSMQMDSPYQISKIVGELYGNYYHRRFGVPFIKARFQNVYGPGEILGAGRWRGTPATVWRNVVPTFIFRALHGLPISVDNADATRDFIYVDDIVEGLLRCALVGAAGEVYNLATGEQTPILELASLVVRLTGALSGVEVGHPRAWDHSIARFGSTDKAQSALGFQATVGIEKGLARTVAWTRDNLARIRLTMAGHAAEMAAAGDPLHWLPAVEV